MRLVVHLLRVVTQAVHLSVASRRPTLLIVLVVVPALVAIALLVQFAAPLVIYPFV